MSQNHTFMGVVGVSESLHLEGMGSSESLHLECNGGLLKGN